MPFWYILYSYVQLWYMISKMESQIEMFSAEVISNGRITIPDWLRTLRGIKKGSIVSLQLLAVENKVEMEGA